MPAGYERLLLGHAKAVVRTDLAPAIQRALVAPDGRHFTLFEYAREHPERRELRGRGAAYAVPLPAGGPRVVVRHNRHGGLLAPLTRDLFLAPTRAPRELAIALELRRLGVPTPELAAYAVYPPTAPLQRADVATLEIPESRDLAAVLRDGDAREREAALDATARLVGALARAGARHADLNAKNVLLAPDRAYVLDVDRVRFGQPKPQALQANIARLVRSLRKWRDGHQTPVEEREIAALESAARAALETLSARG